jgi:hypothetical protein
MSGDHHYQPSDIALRVKAVESLLVEKKLIDPQAIERHLRAQDRATQWRRGSRQGLDGPGLQEAAA